MVDGFCYLGYCQRTRVTNQKELNQVVIRGRLAGGHFRMIRVCKELIRPASQERKKKEPVSEIPSRIHSQTQQHVPSRWGEGNQKRGNKAGFKARRFCKKECDQELLRARPADDERENQDKAVAPKDCN
jgi:hypothetical protein